MKVNDKTIIAFLVSLGLFSTIQAKQYIKNLSTKEKKIILSVVNAKNKQILLCNGVTDLATVETKKRS
jgi:hypothetical protein